MGRAGGDNRDTRNTHVVKVEDVKEVCANATCTAVAAAVARGDGKRWEGLTSERDDRC